MAVRQSNTCSLRLISAASPNMFQTSDGSSWPNYLRSSVSTSPHATVFSLLSDISELPNTLKLLLSVSLHQWRKWIKVSEQVFRLSVNVSKHLSQSFRNKTRTGMCCELFYKSDMSKNADWNIILNSEALSKVFELFLLFIETAQLPVMEQHSIQHLLIWGSEARIMLQSMLPRYMKHVIGLEHWHAGM